MGKKKEKEQFSADQIVFGAFWQVYPNGDIELHHYGLLKFLADKGGFFWLQRDGAKRLCRMEGMIVDEADITDVEQYANDFIASIPEELGYGVKRNSLQNKFVRGIDNYINFPKLRLLPVKELEFHFDTKSECSFYMKNGVVRVTADAITINTYESLQKYIWRKQIKPHTFTLLKPGEPAGDYQTFCENICRKDDGSKDDAKFASLRTIIGYMLHRHWNMSRPVIPCVLDSTSLGLETAEGGTGKSQIFGGMGYIRNMAVIDGKIFSPGSSFPYQLVSLDTEILYVDDLDRNTSFENWFSVVTTGLDVNHKNKAAFKIPLQRTPKIGITSNFPIKSIQGRSTDRRKIEFECGIYYSTRQPIDDFGKELYNEWDEDEFNRMLNFLVHCVQDYLLNGILNPPSSENSELRKLIGLIGGIDLKEYLDDKIRALKKNRLNKKDLYTEFLSSYRGQQNYYRSPHRFTLKVHKYLDFHKVEYIETPARSKEYIEILDLGNLAEPDTETGTAVTGSFEELINTPPSYGIVEPTAKKDEPTGTTPEVK
jgi:hypothetical protein